MRNKETGQKEKGERREDGTRLENRNEREKFKKKKKKKKSNRQRRELKGANNVIELSSRTQCWPGASRHQGAPASGGRSCERQK